MGRGLLEKRRLGTGGGRREGEREGEGREEEGERN
jgi:hypothetical protein